MSITKEQVQYVALDDQGAGRCGIGEATLGHFLGQKETDSPELEFPDETNLNLFSNIIRAGIRPPDSGRTDLHPLVTDLIKQRLGIEFLDKKIHLLQAADINASTIVLVLATDLSTVPEYVFSQAFDVLHAPIVDPFPNLENDLDSAAAQIYFYALLLANVVETRFAELGISRDKNGIVIPRRLLDFHPIEWEQEFFADIFGIRSFRFPHSGMTVSLESSKLGGPMDFSIGQVPPENPSRSFFENDEGRTNDAIIEGVGRSFFDDEWGENRSKYQYRPYSY